MNDRWKMNRIGFVNFWLYDEEDFPFEDGKLLLRGQNGSGKSITTQSFIPFILDGDRNPGRLDPFGSKDRRMEYYFLGEEGKEEATGYLFLEFHKEHSGQYRTLGIGQRARRGKPMDFWGFVILDGRRVGTDIFLYKEVGSARIPLSRQEMKKALGDETPFTDAPGEYKAMVNQYLFGFRKAEQYEQFIQLLVKVRAPKLSKDLNPTKIYDILNESLQTLSDEDLRVMVDAMEKMDGIQDRLEQMNRANADVQIIRNEYRRYNQYVLGKKAQFYLESKGEVEKATAYLERQMQQKQSLSEEQEEKTKRQLQVEEELQVYQMKREGLMDTDLEDVDRKLDQAKNQKAAAEKEEKEWEERFHKCQENIRESDEKIRQYEGMRDQQEELLRRDREELAELQEVLQWKGHEYAMGLIKEESSTDTGEVTQRLIEQKRFIREGKNAVGKYEAVEKQYDEQAQKLDVLVKGVSEQSLLEEKAEEKLEKKKEELINALFHDAKQFAEWKIQDGTLQAAEQALWNYQGERDAGRIRELLYCDYEGFRKKLQMIRDEAERKRREAEKDREELLGKIKALQEQPEIEPERGEEVAQSRKKLQAAGVRFVPFYKAVEFEEKLTDQECARLEAQLQAMGILDALIVARKDRCIVEQNFPELRDTMLCVDTDGISDFSRLKINEELEPELQEETHRILSHMYEQENAGGIWLREDGAFRQGILTGRMDKEGEAAYVGTLARKRRKERMLQELQEQEQQVKQQLEEIDLQLQSVRDRQRILEQEYREIPGFEELDEALQELKQCQLTLEQLSGQLREQEKITAEWEERKKQCYQQMLQSCKALPYGRTLKEYEEAENAAEDYKNTWQNVCGILQQLQNSINQILNERDKIEREEENRDTAAVSRRSCRLTIAQADALIRQYEEYLNSPEMKEKARELEAVKKAIADLEKEKNGLHDRLLLVEQELSGILEKEAEDKRILQEKIGRETVLRNYFEEELSLKLVVDRGSRTLTECAQEAVKLPRETDLAREYGAVFQSLYTVYQQHNGNLVAYGTAMEDCFEDAGDDGAMRKRVQIFSVWNGKKLYLEEFYRILKTAIEETELLIQKKDREIFEDILSQTISQQLTDRIAESRRWVKDMSELMRNMDTSMGLSFALDWKPRSADNDQELDTAELEHILLRDRELLTTEDIEKVAAHFRSKIRAEKQRAEEMGSAVNYMDMVRDALDYRKWFAFQMSFYRNKGEKKQLSNAAFNRFSGGEKAMAMYVPLFAAVNAQYQKAEKADHPRIMALDEAFAGVDDKNISSMFELVERLDFDYIMNSQVLWGCFETVHGLKIAELLRPQDASVVTVIRYTWNGREKILDEQ